MGGYVYVMTNKAMPRLVKVGFTTRSPEERAAQLTGTHSPHPYVVAFSVRVTDPPAHERSLADQERERQKKAREEEERQRIERRKFIEVSYGARMNAVLDMPNPWAFWFGGELALILIAGITSDKPHVGPVILATLLWPFLWWAPYGWLRDWKAKVPAYRTLQKQRDAELNALESDAFPSGGGQATVTKQTVAAGLVTTSTEPPVFTASVAQHVAASNDKEVERLKALAAREMAAREKKRRAAGIWRA